MLEYNLCLMLYISNRYYFKCKFYFVYFVKSDAVSCVTCFLVCFFSRFKDCLNRARFMSVQNAILALKSSKEIYMILKHGPGQTLENFNWIINSFYFHCEMTMLNGKIRFDENNNRNKV